MSGSEVSQMLKDCAWREVRKEWASEAKERSKLEVLQRLMGRGCKSRRVQVGKKRLKQISAKLRGAWDDRAEGGVWQMSWAVERG